MSSEQPDIDKFEIIFRILGNEVFAMNLLSQSKVKNWAAFGVLVLISLTFVFAELAPVVQNIIELIQTE